MGDDAIDALVYAFNKFAEQMAYAVNIVAENLIKTSKSLMYKKISKKKFIKLLQSKGIQRNEINKIVANNKEPYTYKRFLETINKYKKR
jgi:hypothetical protein